MSRITQREEEDNDILGRSMCEDINAGQHMSHEGYFCAIKRSFSVTA